MKNLFLIFLWIHNTISFKIPNIKNPTIRKFKMSDLESEPESEEKENKIDNELSKFFEGNRLVNYGRSVDEDGKSNIWGMEPNMIVEGNEIDYTKLNTNILIFITLIIVSIVTSSTLSIKYF